MKIRRIWVVDKHEIEDSLPRVYEEATGTSYPGGRIDDNLVMGAAEMQILRNICSSDELLFQLTRELLSVEKRHKSMLRRAGLFEAMEQAFHRNFYDNEDDAVQRARKRRDAIEDARLHAEERQSGGLQEILDHSAAGDAAQ